DRSRWGSFDQLQERNNDVLHAILDRASTNKDAETKKIGDYYASCMDEPAIEKKGAAPLEADLKRIAALNNITGLPQLVGQLHTEGVNAFFSFGAEPDFKDAKMNIATLDQGGLGLPDRDYYFRDDAKSTDIRKQYTEHVATMEALAGTPRTQSAAAAETVMRIETALAAGAFDAVSRRDPVKVYHKLTTSELSALTPHFNWAAYFKAAQAPSFQTVNASEPEFLKAVDQVIGQTSLDDIKTYLVWHVVHTNAFILSSDFVNENFRFYSATLQGAKELRPRWRRCVSYVDGDMGEALGKAFVKDAFGASAKADTLRMVHEIEGALEQDINTLTWMTDTTKQQALVKLQAVENKIGYPDHWRDYGPLTIVRGDALGNSRRSNMFEFHRQMGKIGKPLDKSEWDMTPPTVNAYYEPQQNNINFPAGILQPPFYSSKADAAVNYGGAGMVIGHELTHGFDDEGRQFDAKGNLNDWWTPEDAKAFEEKSQCLVDEYSAFTAIDDVKLNGKLTLGENTADSGGVRLALMAYMASEAGKNAQTLDGFTPEQRVFMGFAQVWCENRRPEYERLQAQTNPHAPGRYRVNGVVSNMPEFQKAFACKADAPMVRQNACRVW
ncbi:MAG TPA: M13 family metallopeptidase, partial [Vicinamibacterales bacterium]|nr:M13 family metallopeptidase [Vicinamibacterales bacterium]